MQDRVAEYVADSVAPDEARSLRAHVEACPACAKLVERQRRLAAWLAAAPAAPLAEFPAPALPDVAGGRVLSFPRIGPRMGWAAAAAAGLAFAAALWSSREGVVPGGAEVGHAPTTVRVDRVFDVAENPPQVDESLLAMTGGVEAVVMRRPTEIR